MKKTGDEDRAANASSDDPYSGEGGVPLGTPQEMVTPYDAKAFASFRFGVHPKRVK